MTQIEFGKIAETLESAYLNKDLWEVLYLQDDILGLPEGESLQRYYTSKEWSTVKVDHTIQNKWMVSRSERIYRYHIEFLPVKGEILNFKDTLYVFEGILEGFSMSPHNPYYKVGLKAHFRGSTLNIEVMVPQYGEPKTVFYKETI